MVDALGRITKIVIYGLMLCKISRSDKNRRYLGHQTAGGNVQSEQGPFFIK